MLHELTHFAISEVFKNNSKPYFVRDSEREKKMKEITEELKEVKEDLDPILKGAFTEYYKKHEQIYEELIVRIPEMIVQHEIISEEPLKNHAGSLFNFYKNYFLVKVGEHNKKLKSRLLGNLPEELYSENRKKKISLGT